MGRSKDGSSKATKPRVKAEESAELLECLKSREFDLAKIQFNKIATMIEKESPDHFCKGDILAQVKDGDDKNVIHLAITHHQSPEVGPSQ